ncbi:serine palmitoyltransferase 2-like protein [Dinothrombium tinctorium]|uniref:Serine palmitoyltransferase 2-like protein n=1 Tax=Dinothrombium tinctorium TaxID=1965070 RepID=A0A443REF7_9ACAR|nr:serine palmitoyltransferase 2-like protein [Dinothrombium tinctorium]
MKSTHSEEHNRSTLINGHVSDHRNGFISGDAHLKACCESKKECKTRVAEEEEYEETPLIIALLAYLSYVVLIIFGHLRDFLRNTGIEKNKVATEKNREGYVPLYKNFESFYTRNVYRRIRDGWNQPIASMPGAVITLLDRESDDYNWTFRIPGTTRDCINMGSYNYLGYAENKGKRSDDVQKAISELGVGIASTRHEFGKRRIDRLARNTIYFRQKLKQKGFIVYGNDHSPVVPMMIYFPSKIVSFVRDARCNGVAAVGAGFPATPLIESRVRFCLSASHTKEMLDKALDVADKLGDKFYLKYSRKKKDVERRIEY